MIDLVGDLAVRARPLGASSKVPLEAVSGGDGEIVRTIERLTLRRTPRRMDLGPRRALGASLIVGRRALGRIAVVESEAPLDEFMELALSHGAELISFLLMRQLAILEGRREAGGLFFDSLMSDELSNEEAAERAVTMGLRLTRPSIALVIGARASTHEDEEPLKVAVERAMSSCPHVVGKAAGEGDLVVLFEPDESNEDASLDHVARRILSLAEKGGLGEPLVGAGSARTGLAGVRRKIGGPRRVSGSEPDVPERGWYASRISKWSGS